MLAQAKGDSPTAIALLGPVMPGMPDLPEAPRGWCSLAEAYVAVGDRARAVPIIADLFARKGLPRAIRCRVLTLRAQLAD